MKFLEHTEYTGELQLMSDTEDLFEDVAGELTQTFVETQYRPRLCPNQLRDSLPLSLTRP